MTATDDLILAVEQATGRPGRRNGGQTRLLCPVHDDHTPSLDIRDSGDGTPLVLCRSCGASLPAVAEAVGKSMFDYLVVGNGQQGEWTPRGDAVAVYHYVDEKGALLYDVCRTADKQFPQRRPDPSSKTGWRWNLGDARRVVYRLPAVLKAAGDGSVIYVAEGEKDVHALERAGVVATCNPGGAGKWRAEYGEFLRGASEVVVVADRDDAGRDHARAVVASTLGVAHVRVVEPREGKDAADHLAAGLSVDDFIALTLDPVPRVFVSAREFVAAQTEPPVPLWGDDVVTMLPAGGFCILAGRPGTGKTTFVLDLVCHLAAGRPFPSPSQTSAWQSPWPVPRPLRIALIENEGPQEMFRQKLSAKLAAFGDESVAERVYVHSWSWGAFSFADDEVLERVIRELDEEAIDLVIGDPLGTLGLEGVGSPAETREFIRLLRPLGMGTTRAFLFLHHFRERVERNEDELARISGAWGGHLDTLITLSSGALADQARLNFPKIRWGSGRPPRALVLGRVWNTAAFEALAEEGEVSLLEPVIFKHLETLRAEGGGRDGKGWSTYNEIGKAIDAKYGAVKSTLEGAPHLFFRVTGDAAKQLGARRQASLWGLKEWPAQDFPELFPTPDEPGDNPREEARDFDADIPF